jgi:hypothetical protein
MPGKMRKLSIYTPEAMRLPIINKKARRMRMPVWLKENHASMSDLRQLYNTLLEGIQ